MDRIVSALRLPGDRRQAGWMLSVVAVGVIAGAVGIWGFARSTYVTGPARLSVSVQPAIPGRTIVHLPPFGTIEARTHTSPLRLDVRLEELDLDRLQAYASDELSDEAIIADLRDRFVRGLLGLAVKGTVAAALIAFFVAWTGDRSWRMGLLAGTLSAVLTSGSIAWAFFGYDPGAFREPVFRGPISVAPEVIGAVQSRMSDVSDLRRQVRVAARSLAGYYARPQSFRPGGSLASTFKVLAVSDLHLDPVGLELAENLAREFDADVVLNLGDINNYGTPLEADAVAASVETTRPLLFVAGNHDSPDVVRALASIPSARVLDGTSTVVAGLRVYGVSDPASKGTGFEPRADDIRVLARRRAGQLTAALASGEATPDVVMVHNPLMAAPFSVLTPLIMAGHSHTPELRRLGEAWLLNVGTTGGVNFTDVRSSPHIPHSAAILYFTADEPRRLIAVDRIELSGETAESSMRRTIIDETLLPAEETTAAR